MLLGHEQAVTSAVFSHDGTRIATGSVDGTTRIWDWRRSTEPVVLRVDASRSQVCVEFSPDDTHVLVHGSGLFELQLWRADGLGDPIVVQDRRRQPRYCSRFPSFGAEGSLLLGSPGSGAADELHRVSWRGLLDYLRASTTACLTPEQRMKFLAETSSEATAGHDACERRHGRKS